MIAYLLISAPGLIGILINLLVFALFILILFWILGMLGVPAQIVKIISAILALILILSLFTGCASLTPAQKAAYSDAAKTLGSAVANNVASAATSDLKSGNQNAADYEMAAAFGLFSGVSQIIGNGDASTIISSFSNHTMPKTAAAVQGIPVTPANLSALATVISTAAGAPPAK